MKPTQNSLSAVAPTLADLKKLPMEQKCRLFLVRLAVIGRNESALNKHNLMMPGDPYALANGYPDTEKTPVREHLLGAPWTRLVNEGYLVDLTGQGFYKVSEEGKEYIDENELVVRPSHTTTRNSNSVTPGAPRALLSYSWDSPEHRRWVTRFAERLQGQSGVEIVLDVWHLNPGDDKLHFMERAVTDSDFVISVCTPDYAERANKRHGGVGYESVIITAELAEKIPTSKFIPVLRKGTWASSLPIYLKSRMGVDLSDDPYRQDEYERLIRALHKEPLQPPVLGNKPEFSRNPPLNQRPADFVAAEAGDGSARSRTTDQPRTVQSHGYSEPMEYLEQLKRLRETDILKKIWSKPRWRIRILPTEFKKARFRDLEQCRQFMVSSCVTVQGWFSFPWFPDQGVESGNEWVGREFERFESNRLWWAERSVLFRSAQFVHNRSMQEIPQLGGQIHVLEILDVSTAAFEFASRMAQRGVLSPEAVITFDLYGLDGKMLTWPKDVFGHSNAVGRDCWCQDETLGMARQLTPGEVKAQRRELALGVALDIYSRFGWSNPPKRSLTEAQQERFGGV